MQTTQRRAAVRQERSRMPTIPRIGMKPSTVTERRDEQSGSPFWISPKWATGAVMDSELVRKARHFTGGRDLFLDSMNYSICYI